MQNGDANLMWLEFTRVNCFSALCSLSAFHFSVSDRRAEPVVMSIQRHVSLTHWTDQVS